MYHSPFHLIDPSVFEGDADAALIKRRLGLEKRKLMAEFELAGAATITHLGRELQRQDVTSLFDELQDTSRLMLHLRIWEHKAFLHFLETGIPGRDGEWLYPENGEEWEPLVRFVSPFYAEALNQYLHRCLQLQADPRALLYELRADDWLLPMHIEDAYRYPTRFFTEKKNELIGIRYHSENGGSLTPAEIRGWCADEQIHVLNRLPDHFDDMRYMLAERLNNLCVLYDRKNEKRKALAVIERASTIRVNDEELERLVPSNLRIIRNKNSPALLRIDPDTGKRKLRFFPLIIAAFIVFRMLTTGAGCFDNKRKTDKVDLRNLPGIEMPDLNPEEQSFRSLIRSLEKPQEYTAADTFGTKPMAVNTPQRTGDDPYAALFQEMRTNDDFMAARADGTPIDSSYALFRNQTTAQAIFLLQYGGNFQRSVYVAPGEAFELAYPNAGFAMQLYAGRDWSDTCRNSYLRYRTETFAPRQAFRGGFRTRLSIVDDESATGNPMFARGSDFEPARDTFTLKPAANDSLSVYYNLGAGF